MTLSAAGADLAGLADQLLDHERPAWDLLPVIGLVHSRLGLLVAEPLPTPDELWTRLHPVEAVDVTGHVLERLRPAPTSLAGIWLVVESWQAPPSHAEEIHRRHLAGGSVPRFETLPGAIEQRDAVIVARDGTVTWSLLERVSGIRRTVPADDGTTSGRLVDAMRHAMQLALGET